MISWKSPFNLRPPNVPKWCPAFALIPRTFDSQSEWLCLWDENRSYFDFITAVRSAKHSFRDDLQSQVCKALDLRKRDVLISNMAQLNLEFAGVLPGEGNTKHVVAAFYLVHLYSRSARDRVEELSEGRWLSTDELLNGQTLDGWGVSPNLSFLLRRSDVIPTHRQVE